METYKDDNHMDSYECPICYDSLVGTERTLSCGHVFCHDCLVQTLISRNNDGSIRGTIACPICRHLTFIRRQKEPSSSKEASIEPSDLQTLEVPLPNQRGQFTSRNSFTSGLREIFRRFRGTSQRAERERLITPEHKPLQTFFISGQGRPMSVTDPLNGTTNGQRRRRRRGCTSAASILMLLSAFTILALVAVILPWILLV
ncbi:unnamed protein product [Ophioblennius macclurei]